MDLTPGPLGGVIQGGGRRPLSWQGYMPILLTLFLGIATTWALVQEVGRLENQKVETDFSAAARDRVLAVERELQISLNLVQDIGSFFDANSRVRRRQFREFVQPVLKRDSSIHSLEWVAKVEPEERASFLVAARISFPRFQIIDAAGQPLESPQETAHYTLLYSQPYSGGETPLGLDYSSVPGELATLNRAMERTEMLVSEGTGAKSPAGTASLLNVYLPVFEKPDTEDELLGEIVDSEQSADIDHRLRGFAIGRFRIDELVNRALSHLSPSGIDIDVKLMGEDRQPRTLYTHHSRLRESGAPSKQETGSASWEQPFTLSIGGKEWILVCRSMPGSYVHGTFSTRFVLVGGMAFTLLLAAYLYSLIGRAEEVERLVSQRTIELEHSNEALNRQVRERLKAEQALQAMNTNLEQRVTQRAEEAGRRAAELEQFAYVVSHDLKAPLRAVSNLAGWLTEDLKDAMTTETEEQLALMRDRVARMHGLIEGLLAYSRIGRTGREVEDVDCAELVTEVIDSLAPPPGFVVDVAPDLPVFQTDRLQLGQVFSNLIGNAVKHHGGSEGRIQVKGRDKGSYCEFSVADDGQGIAPEYHDKVFMMFQTLQVKDFGSNTGIGLALVKKIVEENGGVVHLKSEPGSGTEISFTWHK